MLTVSTKDKEDKEDSVKGGETSANAAGAAGAATSTGANKPPGSKGGGGQPHLHHGDERRVVRGYALPPWGSLDRVG